MAFYLVISMATFKIDFDVDSAPVLDRVKEAYGFTSKLMLAQHLDIAASSLSSRYKRGGFPSDIAVRCVAETGVNLQWLATGEGRRFDDEKLNILKLPRKKIIDGQLYEAGILMLDKVTFLPGSTLPKSPICVLEGNSQFIVDTSFTEVYDDQWLIGVEGKTSIRTLTRIPIKKVRVSGVGMAFDCAIDDITVIGRVVLTIH